jgi:hypothetical protein
LEKDMENLRKKESDRNPGNKMSLKSNKKYSGRPHQQTRTSGRQISDLKDKLKLKKKKNKRNLSQTTQEL